MEKSRAKFSDTSHFIHFLVIVFALVVGSQVACFPSKSPSPSPSPANLKPANSDPHSNSNSNSSHNSSVLQSSSTSSSISNSTPSPSPTSSPTSSSGHSLLLQIVVGFEKTNTVYPYEIHGNQPLVFRENLAALAILCKAVYPIQWKTSSHMSQKMRSMKAVRSRSDSPDFAEYYYFDEEGNSDGQELGKTFDPNATWDNQTMYTEWKHPNESDFQHIDDHQFFYHLHIELNPDDGLFGYLGSCQTVGEIDPSGSSSRSQFSQKLELFAPRKSTRGRYFFGERKEFIIKNHRPVKTNQFVIPCPLINETIAMEIKEAIKNGQNQSKPGEPVIKLFKKGNFGLVEHTASKYDPDVGFYVTGVENETFHCRVDSGRTITETGPTFEFIQSNKNLSQIKSKEAKEENEENWLDVTSNQVLEFQKPINNDTSANVFIGRELRCRTNYSSSATRVQLEHSTKSKAGFGYFPPVADKSSHFVRVPCEAQFECDFLSSCFTQICASGMTRGVPCKIGDKNCFVMKNRRSPGILKCTFGGNQVYAYTFIGLDDIQCPSTHFMKDQYGFWAKSGANMRPISKDYMSTSREEIPPQCALIQLQLAQGRKKCNSESSGPVLYTDEIHIFECTASSFLFTHDLIFRAQYANGTTTHFPHGSMQFSPRHDSDEVETHIRINVTTDMIGVVCFAPRFKSSHWIVTTYSFTAKNVTLPVFTNQKHQTNQIFYVGEESRTLFCSATGDPKPDLRWTYENKSGSGKEPGFSIKPNHQGSSTSLQFETITMDLEGTYVCEARNRIGTVRQSFHVQVKEPGLSMGAIFGIVLGILFFVVAFGFVLINYLITRRKLRNLTAREIAMFEDGDPERLQNEELDGKNAHFLPFNKKYAISDSEFAVDTDKVLGSGEFGIVYGGTFHGREVAIKTTKSNTDVDNFKSFLNEIKLMTYIDKHPNVVQILGSSTSRIRERIVFAVVELGTNGSLNSFLMKHKSKFVDTLVSSQLFRLSPAEVDPTKYSFFFYETTITTFDLVKWCGQIAAGMSHLASKKVFHGDLAGRNVLLFEDYTAKITDFGLARQLSMSSDYQKKEKCPLPWRIMAPESLKYLQFSTKSDVWAFGVLAWEIFSLGAVPYSGLNWTQDFVDKLEQGLRLEKPKLAPAEIFVSMSGCWNPDSQFRPDFAQLETFYNEIIERSYQSAI